jgi:UDPglucose 6-dehydrogenase
MGILLPFLSSCWLTASGTTGADAVLVLTEWPEFVNADPEELGRLVRTRTVIDGRNCIDGDRWA